jgi:uncharacterized repeat protein (TIGR01451 family)
MTRTKQRTAVGLLAVLAVVAAALLAVFGLPYGASNPEAFAHLYTAPNGNQTHLHIDADITNGTRPCAPIDATATVAVDSVHYVGVCLETYVGKTVNSFELHIRYTGDPDVVPPTTINSSPTELPEPVWDPGDPEADPPIPPGWVWSCPVADSHCLDVNPDANDGADHVNWAKLGTGWDCTALGLLLPRGEDPATPNVADAVIVCNAANVGPDRDLAIDPGLLATIEFTATGVGVDTIDFGTIDATNLTGVFDPRLGGGTARCSTKVAADQVGCFGATITKAIAPDIEVTKTCDDQVLVGGTITCDIHVENIGDGPATNVAFVDGEVPAPASLDFSAYTILPSDPGCTLVPGLYLACPLGLMAPGDSFDITVDATAAGACESHNVNGAQATVTAGLADEDPDNNTATAEIHEFCPDITVTKLNVSGGGSVPASGWGMDLYNTADCTGTFVHGTTGVDGTVNFPNVGNATTPLPKTYCVKETLLSSAWGRKDCTTGADIADPTQAVVVDGVDKVETIDFCNALLVATEAYDKGASAEPATVSLPAGGSATVTVSEVVYVVEGGPSPTIVHSWNATAHGNVTAAWVTGPNPLVFSTGPYNNGDEFTVSKNITVTCTGAGGGYVDLALQVGAANNPPVSPAQIIVNCETGGQTKSPASANLWLCEGVNCRNIDGPLQGRGQLVIAENVSGITGDPLGAGAFEFQIKFDHKIFDIVVTETNWLWSTPGRIKPAGACAMTIINESDIRFACVSEGTANGPTASGTIANLLVTPDPDMKYRLTPGQNNGVVRTILDENCEMANILGDPIAGSLPGGMMPACGDSTITVRILEGDLNLDCAVNVIDEQAISFRYGSSFGNLLYDPWYDLEPALKDYDIDIKDLQKVFGRDGSNCSAPIPAQAPQAPPR